VGSQFQDLYAQEGDLRGEVFEFQGLAKGFLFLRRQRCGVEAVLAGVLVAPRSAAAIPLERLYGLRLSGLARQGILEIMLSGHGMRIREEVAYGKEVDGREKTAAQ